MSQRRLAATSAALFCLGLGAAPQAAIAQPAAVAATTVQPPLPAPPPGAGKGYPLRTKDGRCAMWVSSDEPAAAGEQTTWSGACKDGYADGFGIQEFFGADKTRLRYVGSVRQGMWYGMGRHQEWGSDGKLVYLVEGVYRNDQLQGASSELLATGHADNAQAMQRLKEQGIGRPIGDTYVQIQQFYKDDAVLLLCSGKEDCGKEAAKQGHTLPVPDFGPTLSQELPYGGWNFELKTDEQSERTKGKLVAGKPLAIGMCLEKDKVQKGREPRLGAVLFPAFSAWQVYLKSDYQCDDLSATLDGLKLNWTSQCRSPDGSELIAITQERSVSDKGMRSHTEVTATKRGKVTARTSKDVTGAAVERCTDDMVRAGEMSF